MTDACNFRHFLTRIGIVAISLWEDDHGVWKVWPDF